MSVVTVFLTVSLITFLDMMTKLSPILALKQNLSMSGDFDVQITGKYDGSIRNVMSTNTNWYTDELEFFNAPYMTKIEQVRSQSENSVQAKLPFVNFTAVEERARQSYPDPS